MNKTELMSNLEAEAHGVFVPYSDVMPDDHFVLWHAESQQLGICVHYGVERMELHPDTLVFITNR